MARYEEIGELSEDGEVIAAALRAEADAIVFEATDGPRPARRVRAGGAAGPGGPPAADPDPLQHRAAGVRPVRDRARRGPGCSPRRAARSRSGSTRPARTCRVRGSRPGSSQQAGVPHTVIPDVAAGSLMRSGEVDVVLVGADRIAANGDTANKVGTYPLAVLAARHGIPFYVCAPLSSVDLDTPDGDAIPIEERAAEEVLEFRGMRIAPAGTAARNPAFDVTPAELITGDRHRGGPPHGAVRARLPRPPTRPARASAGQRRLVRGTASSSDGHGRARPARFGGRPDDHGPRAAARVPRAGPAVRRLRAVRPRGPRVRRGPAGGSRRTATTSWRSFSNTAG